MSSTMDVRSRPALIVCLWCGPNHFRKYGEMNVEYMSRKTIMTIASLKRKPYEMPWSWVAFTDLAASGLGGGCYSEEWEE